MCNPPKPEPSKAKAAPAKPEKPAPKPANASCANGQIPSALAQVAPDLLAKEPDIRPVDVIAVK